MPTGPADINYIIPPLTLSDTFYEWYTLTNNEIIDKLNRIKVYEVAGDTGIAVNLSDDGIATVYIDTVIPGDHTFTGNITFDGTVTTVNTNLVTIDDYNLVLGAVNSSATGGTNDDEITNAGGGGIIIAGSSGEKYFLWKAFDGGRTYSAWRISDSLAFANDAKLYSGNNKFVFSEGDDSTPACWVQIITPSSGGTVDVQSYFDATGTTYTNIQLLDNGETRLLDSSILKRFTGVSNISTIGITFGSVVRHDKNTGGLTFAQANNATNAESIGIVVFTDATNEIADVNLLGYVQGDFSDAIASADGTSVLGTGEFYFLSEAEAGKITKNAPTLTNTIRKPILYALGGDKAMVTNYVGNKIVDIDAIYSKLNASTVVINHDPNQFAVGDVVRFEEGITSAARPYGSYTKAVCTSTEEAEALGIISRINYGGSSAASLMTVSGFIDLSSSAYTFEPGQVYFLADEPGGMTNSPPITVNMVRKPMMVAVSPTTGIVQNYVGLVINTNTDTGTSIIIPTSGSGFKNKLINGNFDIWQRGTTFAYRNPISEPDRYCADRWKMINSGGTTADRLDLQVNRIPLGLGILPSTQTASQYGLEFSIGTGGHTAGSETYLYQRVEGIEHLANGFATISFYAKASISNAKLGVSFRRDFGGGTAPDYITTGVEQNSQKNTGFTTVLTNRWQKYAYTFSLPDSTNGVIGTLGTDGPEIRFFLRGGTAHVGEDITEEIDPNIFGVNNYTIQLAQVQFESGQDQSLFELSDPNTELVRCQRYYQTNNADSPFRDIVDADSTATNDDSIPFDSTVVVRFPMPIRNPDDSSLTIKTSEGGVASQLNSPTKSKYGFKATRKKTGTLDINYEIESEL